MRLLIVQLSDVHMAPAANPIAERIGSLAKVIAAELDESISEIHLVVGGDLSQAGEAQEFECFAHISDELKTKLTEYALHIPIRFVVVPGNHDCFLGNDQSMRDIAISSCCNQDFVSLDNKREVEEAILRPLDNYFDFVDMMDFDGAITRDNPYYACTDFQIGKKQIRYHLINSAWMSSRSEQTGSLVFPLGKIDPNDEPNSIANICVIHHPYNWFLQPVTMRPLTDRIEEISDIILVGHEHTQRMYRKNLQGGAEAIYSEGGVLQDRSDQGHSRFQILKVCTSTCRVEFSTYLWDTSGTNGHYARLGPAELKSWTPVSERTSSTRISSGFELELNDPGLPVSHKSKGMLKLVDFYVPTDLREIIEGNDQHGVRIRSEELLEYTIEKKKLLVVAPDKSGKSCFAKYMFRRFHDTGVCPVFLAGSDLPQSGNATTLRDRIRESVGEQYEQMSADEYEQMSSGSKIVIVDDLHTYKGDAASWSKTLKELESRFSMCILILGEQNYIEYIKEEADTFLSPLSDYSHLALLPFGHIRCDQFVRKWVGLGEAESSSEYDARVQDVLRQVDVVLRSNAIPHHPWIVIVLVQSVDSPDVSNSDNGSYGHLLNALITAALHRTRSRHLPIEGLYAYLAALSHYMFKNDKAVLGEEEARAFHESHLKEYGLGRKNFDSLIDDLVQSGILDKRYDGISFHHKYVFCFFVAWDIAKRLNKQDKSAVAEVKSLVGDLYHDDSANIIIFLAHLTTSPEVLAAMLNRAIDTYRKITPTDLDSDVEILNELNNRVIEFILPAGDPDDNRKRISEQIDEEDSALSFGSHDGRAMEPRSRRGDGELYEGIRQINASLRTIEILGQILRNGATSKTLSEKQTIASEIFKLGRRLMGFILKVNADNLHEVIARIEATHRAKYKMKYPKDSDKNKITDKRIANEVSHHIYSLHNFTAFAICKHIAESVGGEGLEETFKAILESDDSIPNEMYKMAIDLDKPLKTLPVSKASKLNDQLAKNNFARDLLRLLFIEHLYLYRTPFSEKQSICAKLDIAIQKKNLDPKEKKQIE